MRFLRLCVLWCAVFCCVSCEEPLYDPSTVYVGSSVDSSVNSPFQLVVKSLDWNTSFPSELGKKLILNQKIMLIHWNPWIWNDTSTILPADILSGDWDHVIDEFAQSARSFQYPVVLAPLPFSNDSTQVLSVSAWCGNDVSQWYSVQQYVYDRIKRSGAHNIYFMWSFLASQDHVFVKKVLDMLPDSDWVGLRFDTFQAIDTPVLEDWQFVLKGNKPVLLYVPSSVLDASRSISFLSWFDTKLKSVRALVFQDVLSVRQHDALREWLIHDRFQSHCDRFQDVAVDDVYE